MKRASCTNCGVFMRPFAATSHGANPASSSFAIWSDSSVRWNASQSSRGLWRGATSAACNAWNESQICVVDDYLYGNSPAFLEVVGTCLGLISLVAIPADTRAWLRRPSPVKVTLSPSVCYTAGLLDRRSEGGLYAGQSVRTFCAEAAFNIASAYQQDSLQTGNFRWIHNLTHRSRKFGGKSEMR